MNHRKGQSKITLWFHCTSFCTCMEVDRRNKPSIGKRFPSFGLPVNGNESNAKNSRFRPNLNLTGTIYHWSLILRSFSVVSSSAKRDANGFFKVLLLSLHLLISRHPVRKSKFGSCAVTGYCSFKVKQGHLETAIFILHNFYVFYCGYRCLGA